MRVVAGSAGGLRLVAPAGQSTRPTSDRVREATFNALHSLGEIEGARVLDLFAGSGALGIEALSRGAAHATFVDNDKSARTAIKANLETTRLEDDAVIIASEAIAYLRGSPTFDLALLDPPYTFDDWANLFEILPSRIAVAESDRAVEPCAGWAVVRMRRYGTTVVTICRRIADIEETST